MTKIKARKGTANKNKKGTLDQKHTEKINKFEKLSKSLPTKKNKLINLENELRDLKKMNPNKYTHENIRRKSYLMDVVEKLRNEINSIENCKESLNYIVKTLPILINYYDNEEIIDDGINEEFINDINETGKKNILSYFMKESNNSLDTISNNTKGNNAKDSSDIFNGRISRAKLYDSYLNLTELNHKKKQKKKIIPVINQNVVAKKF